jgi:tetratricopeptide (TPR) repeat protein
MTLPCTCWSCRRSHTGLIAEIEYKKAAVLAPGEAAPVSNLSSVKFEQGQYGMAIEYLLNALNLIKNGGTDDVAARKKQTLYERLLKCYMHESRFDDALT